MTRITHPQSFQADHSTPGVVEGLRELFRFRDLLIEWTLRDIRVRYKQSLLGVAWAVLQPLSLMLIYTVVFSLFVRIDTDGIPYPVFSYTALLPWTFFASCVTFGIPSLTNNMNLVTKIYFPREVFPLASIGASFLDFLVASVLFIFMLIFYQAPVGISLLWLPVLLLTQIILTIGVVLFASAVNVFYRDVRFVVPLATQLWLYATPVIYPASRVPEQFRTLYMLNPMAGIIDSYRAVLLQGQSPNVLYLGIALAVSLIIFVGGYLYFKRVEMTFADVI